MSKVGFTICLILITATIAFAQHSFYFSGTRETPPIEVTANSIDLDYPIEIMNIKAVGMGNTQIALGRQFNAMMYNPAFLGRAKNSVNIFGIGTGMPPDTYDAAWYLEENMDEFMDAVSLNQVWDAVNQFFQKDASISERLNALNEIQDGIKFTLDLVEEVTGPAEDPYRHGVSVIPCINVQHGHWGFSLSGFAYTGFFVQLSPTLDRLTTIDIPDNLDNPVQAAKSLAMIMGTLATVLVGPGEGFVNEVYPVAFYMSYIDVVGTVGYGFQWKENWLLGANLKIINRRFSTDRIAVVDYDQILSDALKGLESDVLGVTADLGCVYQSSFGTSIGLSLQNVIPLSSIEKTIEYKFRIPKLFYDRDENGHIITNAEGDTAVASTYRNITIHRPLVLKSPFIVNIGISHPITKNWDVAFDWLDVGEQDSRYDKTTQRICLGSEFRWNTWKNNLTVSFRAGMAQEKATFGLGLKFANYFHIDGAYAYDRFVDSFAYYCQVQFGW